MLDEIIEEGGEGVILRKPFSPYEQGRSENLIKIKVWKRREGDRGKVKREGKRRGKRGKER